MSARLFRQVSLAVLLVTGSSFAAMAQGMTPSQPSTQPSNSMRPAQTAPVTPAAPAQQSAPYAAKPAGVMQKVNINTATAAELDALPNIGEKRSEAIIKGRPYKSTDELVSKKVLSEGVYAKIKDSLVVK